MSETSGREFESQPQQESALDSFYTRNREFFETYVGDSSVRIKLAEGNLATQVPTMAVDLNKGELYVNPDFFAESTPDEAMFGTLHEYEHVLERKELLNDADGRSVWTRHLETIKSKKRVQILDNCFDDIKINRTVVKRAPTLDETRAGLYKGRLFEDTDFTKHPKHLQFSYALTRRAMLPDESVQVAPEVQAELDALDEIKTNSGRILTEYATDPMTPMKMRLALQERYLYPALERLFEKDVEEKQQQGQDKGRQGDEGEPGKDESEQGRGGNNESSENPESYFGEDYEAYDIANPQPISLDDIEEAAKEFIKAKESEKSIEDMQDEAYAQAEGITVEQLRDYRKFWQRVEQIQNPETNESVIEELREVFRQILAERRKPELTSKLPVKEGEILAYPAEAVAEVRAGVREPEVWQTLEPKEKPKELLGDFDVTLVCDRSFSMKGAKAVEQRKAAALIIEALKEFSDLLDEERPDLAYDLNVRTEAWSFGGDAEVEILKPLNSELTEKQRVLIYEKLANTPGDETKDFAALKRIYDGVSAEDWKKIEDNTLRKIVLVLSDGESSNAGEVTEQLKNFRDRGVAVAGVGITTEGKAVETTYAPDGQTCEDVSKLAATVGKLLEGYLKEINS